MPGELFDTCSEPPGDSNAGSAGSSRPFLGVQFQCCNLYSRIYMNREATAYAGHCPRCGRAVEFRIAPGGTDCRFFTAY